MLEQKRIDVGEADQCLEKNIGKLYEVFFLMKNDIKI